ncbi:MAG: hypothetical protein MZU79_04575 [Anaerotruncus sp.]|nr:hypothetical protein [Anaerotruncus sp.]
MTPRSPGTASRDPRPSAGPGRAVPAAGALGGGPGARRGPVPGPLAALRRGPERRGDRRGPSAGAGLAVRVLLHRARTSHERTDRAMICTAIA